MKVHHLATVTTAVLLGAGVASATPPLAVSPAGDTAVQTRCPTFSWAPPPGAEGYELVVYALNGTGELSTQPRLLKKLPAGARSWTLPVGECLERGKSYGWTLRAVGSEDSEVWSEPALFRVRPGPSLAEVEAAMTVLRNYREELSSEENPTGNHPAPIHDPSDASSAFPPTKNHGPGFREGSGSGKAESHLGTAGGIVVNGTPVETKAAPPYFPAEGDPDEDHRFIDCGNGTVHDTVTGLLWLKDANCLRVPLGDDGSRDWWEASAFSASLGDGSCGLSDHSQAGDWRLPSRDEWTSILNEACTEDPEIAGRTGGCYASTGESWAIDVVPDHYWSSTSDAFGATTADLSSGKLGSAGRGGGLSPKYVWPVRDGQ